MDHKSQQCDISSVRNDIDLETVQKEIHQYMKELEEHIGDHVRVDAFYKGSIDTVKGTLKVVDPYVAVKIRDDSGFITDHRNIPFVGYSAIGEISKVVIPSGRQTIFENRLISVDYNPKTPNGILPIRALSYGEGKAEEIEHKLEKRKKELYRMVEENIKTRQKLLERKKEALSGQ